MRDVLAGAWSRGRRFERFCYGLAAVLACAGLFHLAVFAVDGGPWYGPVSWRKPATFGLSFGLTLAAVTWVTRYLPIGERGRALLLSVFAADCVVEVGGITLQAWRHVPSHLNRETPFDSAVSTVLAAGGGVLIVVLGVLAVAAFRPNPEIPASTRLGLRAGFVSLMIGLATGAAMIARGAAEVGAGRQQQAYHDLGFLKPVHGVSLHGILVLPALAWLSSRTSWDEARRTRVVAIAAGGYGLAIAAALAYSLLR
ncbi:hypothetical protein [Actinoallomurus iriomotensis]|uniref:Uncharacterized protein n=1 Tax=Actinoallomurus iriomotensis TaxID=478107 RepID=A0A9W6W2Q8_9ACTN|nr:hypothetical protein [Actinoallomurus iriomotensis]GLY88117.1 hypothetical protein Airi02_060460 [Actinoallomurus iriomotensis]